LGLVVRPGRAQLCVLSRDPLLLGPVGDTQKPVRERFVKKKLITRFT